MTLPVHLTSFVGRRAELAAVSALLRGRRLVTLTGVGGSGKTRLAARLAADQAERWPDGVWWVELEAVSEDELVRLLGQAQGHGLWQLARAQDSRPIVAGDELRATLTVTSLKTLGGNAMVTAESAIVDASDAHVVTATSTLVIRGDDA